MSSNLDKPVLDLDALGECLRVGFQSCGWSEDDHLALLERLRTVEDRLAVLDDPGTPTAILNGMFEAAEVLGHPRYSSSHALGFLLDLIAAQQGELAEWRELYPGETPDQAAEHYVS